MGGIKSEAGRKKGWYIPAGVLEIQLVSVPKKGDFIILPVCENRN